MTAESPSGVTLSVIVVTFVGDACLPACLEHLKRSIAGRSGVEVTVACDDRLEGRARYEAEFPWARWLYVPGRAHPAVMRAHAVRAARGTHVALLEDHCLTSPGWCDAALESGDRPVQGGPIAKAEPDSPLNWAGYFLEFSYFMPPIPEAGDRASDCNTTYSREALGSVKATWEHEFHETNVNWALRDRGAAIVRHPRQLVYQSHPLRLPASLLQRAAFGRTFATSRCRRLSRPMQLLYAAAAPLLPAILTVRMARIARRHQRLGMFLRAYPWFLLLAGAWTLGEIRGYLSAGREPA